ncbi:hypothetical protein WOC76_09235 [Methylocystis sp. IM3]|uniref:hypothetical protein n=1 Tax=unclassified Methylocystis TaxID=2625913 RepID=UPI0030F55410
MSSTRRNILIGLASAPVAAIPAVGSVAPSKDLEALIAAHRSALASFHAAIDAEQAAELPHDTQDRENFFIPDGLGGSLDSQFYGREEVKTLIEGAFESAREQLAVNEKIAPLSTAPISAAIDRKEAETLANADAIFDHEASELAKAERRLVEASGAEAAAARGVRIFLPNARRGALEGGLCGDHSDGRRQWRRIAFGLARLLSR